MTTWRERPDGLVYLQRVAASPDNLTIGPAKTRCVVRREEGCWSLADVSPVREGSLRREEALRRRGDSLPAWSGPPSRGEGEPPVGERVKSFSESRMRQIRTSGSMSGTWKRSRAELLRHRQTKGPETDRLNLNHRATSRLYPVSHSHVKDRSKKLN